jgi:hypothetical protein
MAPIAERPGQRECRKRMTRVAEGGEDQPQALRHDG